MEDPSEDPKNQKEELFIRSYRRKFTKQKSPFEKAGFFSKLLFSWLEPMFIIAKKTEFQQNMHYELRKEDK